MLEPAYDTKGHAMAGSLYHGAYAGASAAACRGNHAGAAIRIHTTAERQAHRPLASLSRVDWGIVAATLLLAWSLILPWISVGGYVIRPTDVLGSWILVGLLAFIVLATVVAGRWPYTRWLAVVPLVSGCLLLGVLGGVAGAVRALNPLLASLPWQEANDAAQTASRLAGIL